MASRDLFIGIMIPVSIKSVVESASNRNEYQKYFMEIKTAGGQG
jgi:hypothetical protein